MPLIRKEPLAASVAATPAESRENLNSESVDARWSAARSLAKDPSSVGALGDALAKETDARVREALFSSLARIQTSEAISTITPFIRSQDAAVRAAALDALGSIPMAVENQLLKLLKDPDSDVRLLVCDTVRRLPSLVASRYLSDLLACETQPNVCAAAIEALSEVGDESALPALADCAARFSSEPFLVFSIKIATDRIAGDGRLRDPTAP